MSMARDEDQGQSQMNFSPNTAMLSAVHVTRFFTSGTMAPALHVGQIYVQETNSMLCDNRQITVIKWNNLTNKMYYLVW